MAVIWIELTGRQENLVQSGLVRSTRIWLEVSADRHMGDTSLARTVDKAYDVIRKAVLQGGFEIGSRLKESELPSQSA